MSSMEWPDILVLVLYFAIVMAVAMWASCRAQTDTPGGYFLAGRSMSWIPIGASTWATNISANMFVGLSGSAAHSGIAVVMYEWHAMWMLILLGWVFLPVYVASGCFSMPQYLKLRFGGQRIRTWLACLHTLITILNGIAGQIFSGALFITVVWEWGLYASISFILVLTAFYTIIGGLNAVIWTDTLQTVILIISATILAAISLDKVGGWNAVRNQFLGAAANYTYEDSALYDNRTCGYPPDDAWHIFRSASDPSYPWQGMIFGLTVNALHAWCTDQVCVQRSLSAKSVSHAKGGALLAAYLKVLPFFFFVTPGFISRILFPQEVACADPDTCTEICQNPGGCYNIAYPLLVKYIMPIGMRGLMMAAMLAALMSSLTSIFNSSSTIFTMDIWRRCRPHAKSNELMVVGRMWILVLAVISMAWMPILLRIQGSDFWNYTQSVAAYLNPPIVACFLMGIGWRGTTEKGAFAGLVGGLIIGCIRMGLLFARPGTHCGSTVASQAFTIVSSVDKLTFAFILFVCCIILTFIVSLLTEPRTPEQLHRVTWWTREDKVPPQLTDDSELEFQNDSEDERISEQELKRRQSSVKYYLLKWVCGVDKTKLKPPRLTKAQVLELQEKNIDIKEDPFWRRFLNVNAVLCASVCAFLHAFWA